MKKRPGPFHARFENAMANQFFDFGKYEPKRSKKIIYNSNYIDQASFDHVEVGPTPVLA